MPSYGIITGAENTVTAVTARRHTFIVFRTVLPAARKYSLPRAPSGSPRVRSDRSPVCAAGARPGHRCSDRKYPREFEWPATTHTRLCSTRPDLRRGPRFFGHAVRVANRRIGIRLAQDRELVPPAPFPVAATRLGRVQAIL